MEKQSLSLFTSLLLACLLVSCGGNTAQGPDSPTPALPTPSSPLPASLPASSASTPTQTQPSSPEPAALEVGSFPTEVALEKIGYGCSLALKRTKENADYVFFEGNGKALMSIDGNLVEFPSDFGAADSPRPLDPGNPRRLVSNEGQFTLNIDVSRGDRLDQELTDIPKATLKVASESGSATTASAVGETGC
jgi:hypothetical protein